MFYCETCHHLKSEYGLMSTSAVNYDMTFNTIILDSLVSDIPHFEGTGNSLFCVFKKPAADSDLFRRMAAYTVLLTKWELIDDSFDKPSVRSNAASLVLGRAISKAEKAYPEYDESVGRGFEELRCLENSDCGDAVFMGRTFGRSLSSAFGDIAGKEAGKNPEKIFTDLGALVYIIDAIDDLDRDYMDGTYNPLIGDRVSYRNKEQFVKDNVYKLSDMLNETIGSFQSSYSAVRGNMKTNTGISDNIVYFGIPDSAKRAMTDSNDTMAGIKNLFDGHRKRNASRRPSS
jgi:hypothetical protein